MQNQREHEMIETLQKVLIGALVGSGAAFSVANNPRTKAQIFELQNLAVGKIAPEIVGVDVTGKAMKLSDYRGKVVMLDFFGNW